ncbi:MAG: substrate-binding domain-containing protein [Defluviitaleaceae bacterium]|nr:substrate-binding domain-containing protein [Defluviitaleaceae bacterium]
MKPKKIFALTLVMVFAFLLIPAMNLSASATTAATVKRTVNVDGFEIATDTVTDGSTVLVPLKFLEEAVGAITTYNPRSRSISIRTASFSFSMDIGQRSYTVNGQRRSMPVAPRLSGTVPYVPLVTVIRDIGGIFATNPSTKNMTVTYFSNISGNVVITGSTTLYPFMVEAADFLNEFNPNLNITVAGGGSGAGQTGTIDGTNNIGMSSSTVSADRQKQIRYIIPVAYDAIAIVIHPSNPVQNLTLAQAAAIFKGEITNWNEVGGNNAPIIVHSRDAVSGTGVTVRELLIRPFYGSDNDAIVETATPHVSNGLQRNAVASDVNAVGFLSIGYVDSTVKFVSLNDIAPTFDTVISGAYPLGRNLYLLSRSRPMGASARIIDFIRTNHAQQEFIAAAEFLTIRPIN